MLITQFLQIMFARTTTLNFFNVGIRLCFTVIQNGTFYPMTSSSGLDFNRMRSAALHAPHNATSACQ